MNNFEIHISQDKTAFAPAELPVGVITAFFGAPFFLYLLKAKRVRL